MSNRKKIEELRRENRALRRKIRVLEKKANSAALEPAETMGQYRAQNYFSYLVSCLREKSFYASTERIFRYFRNSLWVTRIVKYGAIIYHYLQAGAFVLLYTAIFILIIPILLAVTAVTLTVALILRKRNADKILTEAGTQIDIYIPKNKEIFDSNDRFIPQSEEKRTILVVSPFFSVETDAASGGKCMSAQEKRPKTSTLCENISFSICAAALRKAGNFRFVKRS